jgi:hypothetical protein
MPFGNLTFELRKSLVRSIEKINKKIINKKYALVFNKTFIIAYYIYISHDPYFNRMHTTVSSLLNLKFILMKKI